MLNQEDRPSSGVTFIDTEMLDELGREARANPRRRINRNFHPGGDSPCHRLLIALEPDSYIPPHCHADPAKDETLLVLRGRIGTLIFDPSGRVLEARVLDPANGCFGLTIPHGTFHTLVSLESGSVFLEAKAGPYAAPQGKEHPCWAPREGEPGAAAYLDGLRSHF